MARRRGIEGMAQLRRQLDELGEEIRGAALEAVEEAAEAVRDDTRANVRVDTGAGRDGVVVQMDAATISAEVGWVDPDLYYMAFQEHGTSSIPANPALTAAAEQERRRLPGRIERAIGGGR
ncbi:HK97-gp10 family putative phage morphogenesis protein [Actinocorallia longicatena]|uniref:HK97 gp10 family phage protein n=1 Tax=Actinocorallia longicatena TaxID=111803 RepID=A0ABP6QE17_9ACTN